MYVMFLKQVQTSLGITVYSKFTINAKCISEQWAWTVYSHSLQSNPREAALCSPATVPAGISLNNGMATRIMRNHFRKLQSQTTASHDLSSESRMVLAPLVQRVALMNHPHNSCTAVQTWHFFQWLGDCDFYVSASNDTNPHLLDPLLSDTSFCSPPPGSWHRTNGSVTEARCLSALTAKLPHAPSSLQINTLA